MVPDITVGGVAPQLLDLIMNTSVILSINTAPSITLITNVTLAKLFVSNCVDEDTIIVDAGLADLISNNLLEISTEILLVPTYVSIGAVKSTNVDCPSNIPNAAMLAGLMVLLLYN